MRHDILPAQHEVAEARVVEQGDVAPRDLGRKQIGPLVEVDRRDRLERAVVVSDQGVDPEQAHEAEVAKHAQHVGLGWGVAIGRKEAARRVKAGVGAGFQADLIEGV